MQRSNRLGLSLAALALAAGLAVPAAAQSPLSGPVIPSEIGNSTNSGCPSTAQTPCFLPNGSTNPLFTKGVAPSSGTYIGNTGGYNQIVPATPTVTASSYTNNYAIGGLQSPSLFRTTAQPSGILNAVGVASKGGYNTGIAIYAFTSVRNNGALNSTCTDHQAFVFSSLDLPYLVPGFPITLTPSATAGTTQTTAAQALGTSVANQDTTPGLNMYFCAVALTGATTPASTSDLVFSYAISQD